MHKEEQIQLERDQDLIEVEGMKIRACYMMKKREGKEGQAGLEGGKGTFERFCLWQDSTCQGFGFKAFL